jgi:capsular exopolysaccharide synthesis family protein
MRVELTDYLKVIRARWWLVLVTGVVVLAAFLVFSYVEKKTYQGQAQVLVLEQQNTGAILLGSSQDQLPVQPDQPYVQTQAEVIQSTLIAQNVIRTLGLHTTPVVLLQRVTATTDGQSNIVTIVALDSSAAGAADTANAFAEAYIAWSRDNQIASIKAAGDQIQQRLTQAQAQVDALAKNAGRANGVGQNDLQAAEALATSLSSKLEQLRINQQLATGSASVLASAATDPAPVSPNHVRDAGLGVAIGLFLGLCVAFLVEQLDTKIRSTQEIEEIYGAPVLGVIPTEKFRKKDASRLLLVQNPGGAGADAYRGLRIGLDFTNFQHDVKTVLVTSAVPSEGKSSVAANLAVALARAGRRTALLSCDFHRPTTSAFFDLSGKIGLSDYLAGEYGIGEALQKVNGLERLSVVTAGQVPPNPSELFASPRMESLVSVLRESVDWVILDAPPVLAVADAAALARLVDGVLMVVRIGMSKREDARATREQLENIGARILGAAVWGVSDGPAAVRAYSGYTTR